MVGAIPSRYEPLTGTTGNITLKSYYAMARGFQDNVNGTNVDVPVWLIPSGVDADAC